ncbi:hypothetical protein ACKFKF_17295 [Phormidesmis sp. 146-12]
MLLPRIRPIRKIVLAFLSLFLFNSIVAVVNHYSGFNNVSLFEKLLPSLKSSQYLIYFCFFFAVSCKLASKEFKRIAASLIFCFVPNLIYAFIQITTSSFSGYYGLGILNEISPTLTGSVFYFFAILCSLFFMIERTEIKQAFWVVLFSLNVIFTGLTGSRGALLSLLVYLFILVFYALLNLRNSSKLGGRLVLLLIVGVTLCYLFMTLSPMLGVNIQPLLENLPQRHLELFTSDVQEEGRVTNWSGVISDYAWLVSQSPALGLIGLGSGGTYEIFGMLLNAADSQLVYVAVSGGLVGGLLYLNALKELYLFFRRKLSQTLLPIAPLMIGLFWSFMTFSITQEVFTLSKTGGLFWMLCGFLSGAICSQSVSRKSEPHQA